MFFSVDFSVSSKPSLHVVFTSYNMYNALSKRGKRYNYQKMKICVLLSRPSDTQFGHMVPSLAHLKIILYPPKSFIYSIPLVPDHLNKRTTPAFRDSDHFFCTKPVSNLAKRTTWDIKGQVFSLLNQ